MSSTETKVGEAIEPLVSAQQSALDSDGLARLLNIKYAPMEIGRALERLAREGQLLPMGEAPEVSLAEHFALARFTAPFSVTPVSP